MVFVKVVEVEAIRKDRYGRTIGIVTVDGAGLNEELVRAGMAWMYPRYCKRAICQEWKRLQKGARKERLGLWQDPEPSAPWKWGWQRRGRN